MKTDKIFLTIGLISLGSYVILKMTKKESFFNFTPYVNNQICMKGSAAGENRGEFIGRCY